MRLVAASTLLFTFGVALPALAGAQEPRPSEAFFDSDGVRIRYVVQGSGPPVLLVHGMALSAELGWASLGILDSLATRYTVIAPDLRGHGASEKPKSPGAYGIHFVNDLVRLLDHLQMQRAHVVGYSMGSVIALKLLTTHPERVLSAVLAGGGWRPAGSAPPEFVVTWLRGLDRAAEAGTDVAEVFRRPDWPPLPPEVIAGLNRNDPAALAAVLRGHASLTVSEPELRANKVPVLAVVGETDQEARGDVERMAGVLANSRVTIIPETNHVTALTHPMLLEAITRFLSSHRHHPVAPPGREW